MRDSDGRLLVRNWNLGLTGFGNASGPVNFFTLMDLFDVRITNDNVYFFLLGAKIQPIHIQERRPLYTVYADDKLSDAGRDANYGIEQSRTRFGVTLTPATFNTALLDNS